MTSVAARTPIAERAVEAVGFVEAAGLKGKWRGVADLTDGRFSTASDFGHYRLGDVFDGRNRWQIDASGGSHPLNSAFAMRAARSESWLARFAWQRPDFGGAARGRPTSRPDGGSTVFVTPSGGLQLQLTFDRSGALLEARRPTWFDERVTTYGDYRHVGDRRLPFRIVNVDEGNTETITIDRYAHVADPRFTAPVKPDDASAPARGTTVPVTVFPQLEIEATINGRPMSFVFDTGGHSILTPEAAKSLGLTVVGGQQSGGSGTGTMLQQDTRVDSMRIGDAVFRDQHFFVLSLPYSSMERGDRPPMAGLLGLEILERFTVILDYRRGTLRLLPREVPLVCASGWRAIRFSGDMPTVEGKLDGLPAGFTIDTGNNGSLQLYRRWMEANGVTKRYDKGVESVSYGAGGASRNWVSYARSFQIGAVPIASPMVRTTDDNGGVAMSRSEAGNLGTALLANYRITFDYERSRACFDYVPGYVPVPFSRAGMRAIKAEPGYFLVTLVNPGSPAAAAGLRKDDRIVSVDGVAADRLGGGDLTHALTRAPGSRVRIGYQREGRVTDTVVTTREMLAPTTPATGGRRPGRR